MKLRFLTAVATATLALGFSCPGFAQEGYRLERGPASQFLEPGTAGTPGSPGSQGTPGSAAGGGQNMFLGFQSPPPPDRTPSSVAANQLMFPSSDSQPIQPGQTTIRLQPHQSPRPMPQGELNSGVTARDLAIIGSHDVAVIIDKSGSMSEQDCPANPSLSAAPVYLRAGLSLLAPGFMGAGRPSGLVSRWNWCAMQAGALVRATASVLPRGLTIVLFSSHFQVFPNVDARQLAYIFSTNHPGGTTDTTGALKSQLDDYFARRAAYNGQVKPLVIAVVTDGMPNNAHSLRKLIIEATRQMTRPDEISITFLQVGTEREGYDLLKELDDRLVEEGARYDIVDMKTFPELLQAGLARSLVDGITEHERRQPG